MSIQSQKGNMLVGTLVGMGLVVMTAAGLATVITQGTQHMNKLKIGQDAVGLQAVVQSQLKYEDMCEQTVVTKTVNRTAESQPFEIRVGGESIKAGVKLDDYRVKIMSLTLENPVISAQGYKDKDVLVGELRLKYEGSDGSVYRALSLGAVSLVLDGNTIAGCFQTDSQEQHCVNMGGTYNADGAPKCRLCPAGQLAQYNGDGKLNCFNLAACAPGSYMGVGQNGELTCQQPPAPVYVAGNDGQNGNNGNDGNNGSNGTSVSIGAGGISIVRGGNNGGSSVNIGAGGVAITQPASSNTASTKCTASPAICNAYQTTLGRNPDESGAQYYQAEYNLAIASGKTPAQAEAQIAKSIKGGTEYQTGTVSAAEAAGGKKFAAATNTSTTKTCTGGNCTGQSSSTATLASVYATTLGRAPDAAGLAYYESQVKSGRSIADIQKEIANSPEAKAKKK